MPENLPPQPEEFTSMILEKIPLDEGPQSPVPSHPEQDLPPTKRQK